MVERKYKPEGYKCPYPQCKDLPPFQTPQSLGGHTTRVHSDADLDAIILMKEKKKLRRDDKWK